MIPKCKRNEGVNGVPNMKASGVVNLEERTSRLTVLIDPRKRLVFEELCAREDATPSQVVRRLIRQYIENQLGYAWTPPSGTDDSSGSSSPSQRKSARRRPAKR